MRYPDDSRYPWRAGGSREIDRLERRVRQLEDWRLGCLAMIDAIPELRRSIEEQERADAIARGVGEALRSADTRGWTRKERGLAVLGGMGIVVSLALNTVQTFWK